MSKAVWEHHPIRCAPLSESMEVPICIVGGGLAGLTTAYLLAEEGRQVVVLEAVQPGSGETSHTSAHLSSALDDGFVHLERLHGQEGARLAAQSHSAAIDLIEAIAAGENISCEFRRVCGYLFSTEKGEDLDHEHDAARRAGLDVQWAPAAPGLRFDSGRCLCFPRQAQFHPLLYLAGLVQAVQQRGGLVFGHTTVDAIEKDSNGYIVHTAQGATVRCQTLVMATNSPRHNLVTTHIKQASYRTYMLAFELETGAFEPALLWDTADPYHYARQWRSPDGQLLLLVGGEDHHTGREDSPESRYEALEEWCRQSLRGLGSVRQRWSGQVIEPVDSLAFIGPDPGRENVYLITGDSGHGLTHGTLGGLLIRDLILGRPNPWARLYDPGRVTVSAAGQFLREQAETAVQYLDWVKAGEVSSEEQIGPDEGAIVRHGVRKVAVYRDPQGKLHACSAVCPHLGGIVRFNSAEKTWDCPCHGSRFSIAGEVLNGPALHGLTVLQPTGSPAHPSAS